LQRILICGATGHLGQHVLKHAGSRGCFIRALVRTEQQQSDLLGFAHEVHRGDLTRAETLQGACSDVDAVISTAGASVHINIRGSAGFHEIDLAGNRNLLAEATRSGVKKFVYVSVVATPELARTAYVSAKEEFAGLVARSGLDYQIVRPTGFFSAFADLVGMARRGPLPMVGDGTARTNPIDDEEVAIACLEALESSERERSIGGPEVYTRKEIAEMVFAAVGRQARYRKVPAALVRAGGRVVRLFNQRLGDLTEFYLAVARHDVVAPAYGSRRLGDYLKTVARYS
jgi:uncharacterized protein YbjT (DUF2867 family)